MLRPTVIKVLPEKDYILFLEFDNGEQKNFDVKPYIKGTWFNELKNISYFNRVHTNTTCHPRQVVFVWWVYFIVSNKSSKTTSF